MNLACRMGFVFERLGSATVAGRSHGIVLSFLYWSLRRLLELAVLRRLSGREKEIAA